jgi:hypothetical protein
MRALSKRRQGIPRGQALQWVLRNPDGGVFAVQRADLLASFWTRKRPMLANESLISMERAKRVLGSRPEHDRDKPRQVERGASYLSGTFPVLALFLFATLNRPLQSVTSACPGLGLMRIFTTQTGERFDPNAKTSASFDRFRRSSPECRTSLRQVHPFGRDQANFSPDSTIDLRPLAAAHRGKFALSQK